VNVERDIGCLARAFASSENGYADARRLFPSDMEKQHLKLMDTIAALVGTLDNRALFQSIITHTAH
jgi:hypothetical protein